MFLIVSTVCLVLFVIVSTRVIEHEQEDEWI